MKMYLALFLMLTSAPAFAYNIGRYTCKDAGEIAKAIVNSKRSGDSLDDILSGFAKENHEHAVERRFTQEIARQIYLDPFVSRLNPEAARRVYIADCEENR